MGDISIIARRLSDKYVQYGWSGNGGYFQTVGARLLEWYNTPDMVQHLVLNEIFSERHAACLENTEIDMES